MSETLPGRLSTAALGRRRVLLVLAAGVIPWILVPYEAGASLVFSFGLVRPGSLSPESVLAYVFVDTGALPPRLLAWPIASLLYALAVASTALALIDREDRRVTAGLLGLTGLDLLYFAVAFSAVRLGVVAIPLGVAVLWLAAWETWRSGRSGNRG
jgi:uncharacterized protein (TIGR04206 family)